MTQTQAQPRDDLPTVAALAVIAMCGVTIDHEALGHGSACLAAGGHIQLLTSSLFRCDARSPWIDPAGPAGNLLMGALALGLSRLAPQRWTHLRLALLLVTAFSWFWEAGYVIQAMIERHGDLYSTGENFLGEPSGGWRVGAIAAGLALYVATIRLTWAGLLSLQPEPAKARRLARTAWLAATAGAVLAALTCRVSLAQDVHDAFAEIGLAAFPLGFIPRGQSGHADEPTALARSWAAILLAVLVFALFIATLGRGIGAAIVG